MHRWAVPALLIVLTIGIDCSAQETAAPDLSLVSLKPIARDKLNVFFEYTVRNNTKKPVSPNLITIERYFTRTRRFDPEETTNEYGGKTGFGGVKPIPPGESLSGKTHARLVDRSGILRHNRYLQVRVIHTAPSSDTAEKPADVGVIDLENLPADLPPRPPHAPSGGDTGGHLPNWAWQLSGFAVLGGTVWLSKAIGMACWFWLPKRFRILTAVPLAGMLGAGVGFGAISLSPFSHNLSFFGPPFAAFFGLAAAIQAGMSASGSKKMLSVGSGDAD